ncbi:hypothetical protein GQ607_016968 [Colletotrichum asianum]|uniref:Uncharacterized protein n=1 Tax=Colletotrichum asianum TaxID=702518 RepID=A0A8H3VZY6_9PEZI|nr:hypothetical protein GQ607_016968 [Colletotrichum asianum]
MLTLLLKSTINFLNATRKRVKNDKD